MSALFFIIIALAVVHFIYEGIVLPSIRLSLRYKLFALRDELRWLKIDKSSEVNNESFAYLQSAINNSIKLLPAINVKALFSVNKIFEKNPELLKIAKERFEFVYANSTDKMRSIMKDNFKIFTYAFIANNMILFIYLLPIVIIAVSLRNSLNFIKINMKHILSVPESKAGLFDSVSNFSPAC